MKKNNSQRIKEILKKANSKFAGKWMSAEDNSYIFPVDSIVFTGDTGMELHGDLESLPLAIRVTRFVNDIDVPLSLGGIVETGQDTVFEDNPYVIEADGNQRRREGKHCRYGITFITKKQASRFISKIRKRLMHEVTALDKINA